MGGFPTRASRSSLGPTYENEAPVTDPTREIDASVYNINFWQVAGISQTSPIVVIKATVSGGVVTTQEQALAWDPNSGISKISFVYEAAGIYSFAFSSQYPDERGTNVSLTLRSGLVTASNSIPYNGTHTGADNQAVLTDSAQSWTVNELVGKTVYNLTDDSSATITANTATTVTGTLTGGTDDDWDTDDEYRVANGVLVGAVQLNSNIAGEVVFRTSAGVLTDVSEFTMYLF